MKPILPVVLFAAFALSACQNKLGGEVTVDGQKITLESCRSGQVYGFGGVELVASSGWKVRIVANPDGTGNVLVSDGGPMFDDLGACGPFTFTPQNSTVNDVKNVMGKATLDCEGEGHTVKGNVTFENCH